MKEIELSDSIIFGSADDIRAVKTKSGLMLLSGRKTSAMLSMEEASVYAIVARRPISMAEIRRQSNMPAKDLKKLLLRLYHKGLLSVSGRVPKIAFQLEKEPIVHIKAGTLSDEFLSELESYICSDKFLATVGRDSQTPFNSCGCRKQPRLIIEFTDSADADKIADVLRKSLLPCSAVVHLSLGNDKSALNRITGDYKQLFSSVPSEFVVHFNDAEQLRARYAEANILAENGLSWLPFCSYAENAEQFFEACLELRFSCLGLGIQGAQGPGGRKIASLWLRIADKIMRIWENERYRLRVHPLERYLALLVFPQDKPKRAVCFGNGCHSELSARCSKCFFSNMCALSGADFCQFSEHLGIGLMERLYAEPFWKKSLFKTD